MADFTFPELAGEVKTTLDPHADLNHVNLVMNCPESMPVYRGDRDRIQQVLINLVDNAIKFTPASGTVTLDIAFDEAQQAFKIKVIDTGIGIPEIDRPRIFDRFYRVDKSRSRVTGGVGLGLSIVKDIIVAHGGTIDVHSELNVGTTFSITLPLRRDR
jgi:signal transduction histidine kinase